MMSVVGNFVTGTLPPSFNAKFLLLPYQSKSVRASMVIILPMNSSKSNLDDVENKITKLRKGELSKMIANARMKQSELKRLTRVEMPKFKIETEKNLKPTLIELGVKSLFDPMNCNFIGMMTGDSSGLKVDSVLQKAPINLHYQEHFQLRIQQQLQSVLELIQVQLLVYPEIRHFLIY